jgi:hypothetical protein
VDDEPVGEVGVEEHVWHLLEVAPRFDRRVRGAEPVGLVDDRDPHVLSDSNGVAEQAGVVLEPEDVPAGVAVDECRPEGRGPFHRCVETRPMVGRGIALGEDVDHEVVEAVPLHQLRHPRRCLLEEREEEFQAAEPVPSCTGDEVCERVVASGGGELPRRLRLHDAHATTVPGWVGTRRP